MNIVGLLSVSKKHEAASSTTTFGAPSTTEPTTTTEPTSINLAVTGLMGKLTMSAVAYPDKHPATIAGVMGQLTMSATVELEGSTTTEPASTTDGFDGLHFYGVAPTFYGQHISFYDDESEEITGPSPGWRVRAPEGQLNPSYGFGMSELRFLDADGDNLFPSKTGYTFSADDHTNSFSHEKAFDGSTASDNGWWHGAGGGIGYLGLTWDTDVEVHAIELAPLRGFASLTSPVSVALDYWDGSAYVELQRWTTGTWANDTFQHFDVDWVSGTTTEPATTTEPTTTTEPPASTTTELPPSTTTEPVTTTEAGAISAPRWRLRSHDGAINGAFGVGYAELRFLDAVGANLAPSNTGYVFSSDNHTNGFSHEKAFDGATSNDNGWYGVPGVDAYLGLTWGSNVEVHAIEIAPLRGFAAQTWPITITLEYWDGTTYVALQSWTPTTASNDTFQHFDVT